MAEWRENYAWTRESGYPLAMLQKAVPFRPTPAALRAARPRISLGPLRRFPHLLAGAAAAALAWWLVGDVLAGIAMAVLWAVWHLLRAEEGPPVLAMALTFQWVQVTAGVFYCGLTGRRLLTLSSDYRPMVAIGLGCVVSLLVGLLVALHQIRPGRLAPTLPRYSFSLQSLYVIYFVLFFVVGFLYATVWDYFPLIAQGVIALGFLRLVALYLLFRRLTWPVVRWSQILPLLIFEIVVGFSGYFAHFREPLILLSLVLLERFDARRFSHWMGIAAAAGIILFTGLIWLGIRTAYRSEIVDIYSESRTEHLQRIASLSSGWINSGNDQMLADLDALVDRLWAVYYPALAVARVPQVLPHDNGQILWGAVRHIMMPRLFFPDKAELPSDSEMVRKYSGVWVASTDEGTSIAFGYAAEAYIDFGIPWMFLPIMAFGYMMGCIYRWLMRVIWHRDLAVGLVTVLLWLSLHLFERSWIKTLGFSLTLLFYMGAAVLLLDRVLMGRRAWWRRQRGILPMPMPVGDDPASAAPAATRFDAAGRGGAATI